MTVWFVSRHPGAQEWARRQGLPVDHWVVQLNADAISPGDIVAGTLPLHLAAHVCARGARYLHLALDLPRDARGQELTADHLERYGARLEQYRVTPHHESDGQQ